MSAGLAISASLTLVTVTCGGCGITYAIPLELHLRYVNDGVEIGCVNRKCPWGGMRIGKSKVAQLEEELARATRARQWAEQRSAEASRERIQAERRLTATKGVVTKLSKRAANGCCPCCKRTFADLRQHMRSKHPDYGTAS